MSEREKIDLENVPRYKPSPSQNLESDRQIQKKIDMAFSKSSKAQYTKLENELLEKNTYFAKSKIPEINEKDQEFQKTKTTNKFKSTNPFEIEEDYCQKCPSQKNHCPHKNKKEQIKDKYSYPILTSSTYGWMEPVDNLRQNHNINSVTRSFFDHSHL
jgi:hypothetical protein